MYISNYLINRPFRSLGLVTFAALLFYIFFTILDPAAARLFATYDFNAAIITFFEIVAVFGEPVNLIALALIYLIGYLLFSRYYAAPSASGRLAWISGTLLFATTLTLLLKFVFGRYRPELFLETGLYGFGFWGTESSHQSFPSGHASITSVLWFGCYYFFRDARLLWITGIFVIFVASGRLILGAHYPSDVLFGLLLAYLSTSIVYSLFSRSANNHGQ